MEKHKQEKLKGGNVRAGVVRTHLDWVRENQAEGSIERLRSILTSSALLEELPQDDWYPFSSLIELDKAIAELFAPNNPEIFADLGRYSALLNLSERYPILDCPTTHDVFRNTVLLHRMFLDFGNAQYLAKGDQAGEIVLSDYISYSPIFCASAAGYYEACLMGRGASEVTIRETSCQCAGDSSCTFEMTWA